MDSFELSVAVVVIIVLGLVIGACIREPWDRDTRNPRNWF